MINNNKYKNNKARGNKLESFSKSPNPSRSRVLSKAFNMSLPLFSLIIIITFVLIGWSRSCLKTVQYKVCAMSLRYIDLYIDVYMYICVDVYIYIHAP